MLTALRNYFAKRPAYFVILRKIIELDFRKQKSLIKRVFGNAQNRRVLDIGCGTGEYSNLFKKNYYIGIDISREYIDHAKKTKNGKFVVMDATEIKFDNESFDFVLIAAILHHLDDNDTNKVLKEAKRVLKKDGKILILEDAKIKRLDNSVVRFIQRYDIGAKIRTPDQYRSIFKKYFKHLLDWEFINGGCTYYASLMER